MYIVIFAPHELYAHTDYIFITKYKQMNASYVFAMSHNVTLLTYKTLYKQQFQIAFALRFMS